MRVLFIPTQNSGVQYWRMFNFAKAGNRLGLAEFDYLWWKWDLNEVHPWQTDIEDDSAKYAILGEMNDQARQADVIVMQMVHTPKALEVFYSLKEAFPNKPILMETDDNMLSTATYNPAHDFYAPGMGFRKLAVEQLKAADAVICSTPYLAELYSEFCPHTYVCENSIDLDHWAKINGRNRGGLRIGWAGGASHTEDLKLILPAVKNIVATDKDVKFILVHGVPEEFKGLEGVEGVFKWAKIDKYPKMLADLDFDIGMAPLVDNAFNRGKSNLRWLEYSALGIPTVASNVGHFAQTINHGVDGLLSATPEDFEANLRLLISDRRLRGKMARDAYFRIATDFNVDNVVKKYVKTLEEVIERGPVKKAPQTDSETDLGNAAKLVGELLPEENEPLSTP